MPHSLSLSLLHITFQITAMLLQLIYEKLPADISSRHVLLLDPVLASGLEFKPYIQLPLRRVLSHMYAWSGNSAVKAINLLLSKGVVESNIIFLNLIAVSHSDACFCQKIQLHFPCIIYHNSMSCRHPKEYMWFARNFQSSKLWHRRLM
jgi:uracil phosphoribosyltransferase